MNKNKWIFTVLIGCIISSNSIAKDTPIYDRLYLGFSQFDMGITRNSKELTDEGYSLTFGYFLSERTHLRLEYDYSGFSDEVAKSSFSDSSVYKLNWDYRNYKVSYIYDINLSNSINTYVGAGIGTWEMSGFISDEIAWGVSDSDILKNDSQSLKKDRATAPHVLMGIKLGSKKWFMNVDYEQHFLGGKVFDDANLIKIGVMYRLGDGASAF